MPALRAVTTKPEANLSPWGVPGEEHKVWVLPIKKGEVVRPNVKGEPGPYRVQFLFSRPGYPLTKEREQRFIDSLIGDSHIKIVKPEADRKPEDYERMLLQVRGVNFQFVCLANAQGFLGKITAELNAANVQDAENQTYGALAPFLSGWSLNLDIPVHVDTIQVTDLKTSVSSLRVRTPQFEMNWEGGGELPLLVEDFCQYASVYREGLNTNSLFYRFLCFYKIIESLMARRGREARAKRVAGEIPRRDYEVIPEKREELRALLKRLYAWRESWDEMALEQIFPSEALGKKVTVIKTDYLSDIRKSIAHTLLEPGEITMVLDKIEHIQTVNKWVSLCRIVARWMLLNDFPRECSISMK